MAIAINTLEKLQYGFETVQGTLVAADAIQLAEQGGVDAKFPELREPCYGAWAHEGHTLYDERHKNCHCEGRGWVPVVDLETLMESARRAGFSLNVNISPTRLVEEASGEENYVAFCYGGPRAYGALPTLAAYRAVVLRMIAQP